MFKKFPAVSPLLIVVILTMNGCQSTPQTPRTATPEIIGGDAQTLLAQAADATDPRRQLKLRMAAAELLLDGQQYAAAADALSLVNQSFGTALVNEQSRADYARMLARAQYHSGDYIAAQAALTELPVWTPQDYLLIANICQALNDYRCSADGYIQASVALGLDHPDLPDQVNNLIWQNLSRAQSGPEVFTHRYHHAWWLLQQQMREASSIPAQQVVWQTWQRRYPSHPARLRPPETLRRLDLYEAPNIALFLPLTGPVASAGQAIRDGLISALLSEAGDNRPNIRIYDTAAADIGQLWEQALAEGAQVSVGPLLKDQVLRFSELTAYADQPRLVLNYLENPVADPALPPDPRVEAPTANKLFQFGIAIEDEARALANQVLLAGHEKLIVVSSNRSWSQRASAEYLKHWPYPATNAYFTDIKELTQAIGTAMQVEASESRKTEIANILGQPLEFLARGRQDMDAVVAFTNQVEARALGPALRFHFASNLPLYATSQIARGSEVDELVGFNLTEMPLFTHPTASQSALYDAFALKSNAQAELYALGYDAYRLATWLPLLNSEGQLALPAASGYIWLDKAGRFKRDLGLSRVEKGGTLKYVE